jgi:hypothetical protein
MALIQRYPVQSVSRVCIRREKPTNFEISAVKGTWQDQQTFVTEVLSIGSGNPPRRYAFRFEGNKFEVRTMFGPGPEMSVVGETAE